MSEERWSDGGGRSLRLGDRFAATLDRERDRAFLFAPVALGAGISAYFSLGHEPAELAVVALAAIALALRAAVARGSIVSVLVAGLLIAAAGFSLAKVRTEQVRAPVLAKTLSNAQLTGSVIRAESRLPRGQRLTLSVTAIAGLKPAELPAVVRIAVLKSGPLLAPGDLISIRAKLSPPSLPALPGDFDFARTAFFERLGAVGYAFQAPVVLPAPAKSEAADAGWRADFSRGVEDVRRRIGARVRAALPGETGAIAVALITGERTGISPATNAAYKDSGLFHILSISGLHMVIMAGAVFWIVRLLLAAIPAVALALPVKKIAACCGILAAIGYLTISGGAFATVRAAIMTVIMFIAVLLDRPALALRNVAIAAFIILALYPESLLDAGFQMSFAAVTALIAAYEAVRRRFRHRGRPHPVLGMMMFFGGIVLSTIIASIAVAPFAAYHFHQTQQYAVIANLLAVPISNFIVMPAALTALFVMPLGLETFPLWVMGAGIQGMSWCAERVAAIPGAVGFLPAMPVDSFLLIALGGLWFLLWQTRLRALGLAVIAAGVVLAPTERRPDVLVTGGGSTVAARNGDGVLVPLPSRYGRYEIERWLRRDGDGRSVREALKGEAFQCDGSGCVALVKGRRVAVARHPSAVADDCALADVLVLPTPRPLPCAHPQAIIDTFDVWRNGTHAIYIADGGGIEILTVAAGRGDRPWSPARVAPKPRTPLPKPIVLQTTPGHAGPGEARPADGPSALQGGADAANVTIDDELGLALPDAGQDDPGGDADNGDAGGGDGVDGGIGDGGVGDAAGRNADADGAHDGGKAGARDPDTRSPPVGSDQ